MCEGGERTKNTNMTLLPCSFQHNNTKGMLELAIRTLLCTLVTDYYFAYLAQVLYVSLHDDKPH